MSSFLIVDDHPLSRAGTAMALRELSAQHLVREAGTLEAAFAALREQDVDLVLLDLDLGATRGLATLRALRDGLEAIGRSPRVLVLSGMPDPQLVREALDIFATGFIAKTSPREVFQGAVTLTLAGGLYIPATLLPGAPAAREADGAQVAQRFTPREREVAALLIRGLTYKRIAQKLEALDGRPISEHTVRAHVGNIAWKLGVEENAKAGVMAAMARLGLTFDAGTP